jgi:hypothetical protein
MNRPNRGQVRGTGATRGRDPSLNPDASEKISARSQRPPGAASWLDPDEYDALVELREKLA